MACECDYCKMARRIKAEVPNMTPETKQIVNDLFCEWEHADLETWSAKEELQKIKAKT